MSSGYTDKRRRLTPKQEKFVEAVASGSEPTLTSAYTEAGYQANGKGSTSRTNASRLAKKTHVAPIIEERKAQYAAHAAASLAGRRNYVLQRLREEADNPDSRASERISALALLAKASGALDDAKERETKRTGATESDLIAELHTRLSEYVDEPLDVTPDSVATLEGVNTPDSVDDT